MSQNQYSVKETKISVHGIKQLFGTNAYLKKNEINHFNSICAKPLHFIFSGMLVFREIIVFPLHTYVI